MIASWWRRWYRLYIFFFFSHLIRGSSQWATLHSQSCIIGSFTLFLTFFLSPFHPSSWVVCSFLTRALLNQRKKDGQTLNGWNTVIKERNFSCETVKKWDGRKFNEKKRTPTNKHTLVCAFRNIKFLFTTNQTEKKCTGKIIDVSSCGRLAKKGKLEISVCNFTSHRQEEFEIICSYASRLANFTGYSRDTSALWIEYNRDLEMLPSKKKAVIQR